jgi:hypothetical protein
MDYNTSVLSCLNCGHTVAGNFTIPELLRTAGRVPTKVEATAIQHIIGWAEHDLLLLDEEIDQLQVSSSVKTTQSRWPSKHTETCSPRSETTHGDFINLAEIFTLFLPR